MASELVFDQGLQTYKVPISLHIKNRQRLLSKAESLVQSILFFEGGRTRNNYDTDTEPIFIQESFFHYLFGVKEPDCYAAIDVSTRKTILFIPRLPEEYATWLGEIKPPQDFKDLYAVDEVYYTDQIKDILSELKPKTLHILEGENSDSGLSFVKPHFDKIEEFHLTTDFLYSTLTELRVFKTKEEIDLLRYVNEISSKAHIHVMKSCRPGMMEYQLESLFLNYVYYHGGCRHVAYTSICGTGCNSAVLHYGHAAAANNRQLVDGDIILLDMGAQYHHYVADITCSYPVNGKFTQSQREIFEIVAAAQSAVIKEAKPGISYTDLHLLAERVILEGLLRLGLVQGTIEDLLENRIAPIFMPHGLGHFYGIDVHDCGGYNGIKRSSLPGLKSLRTGRVLEEGMTLTVEPGIYFIKHLFKKAFEDPTKSRFLQQDKIQPFLSFGGIRLEDDILITNDGCENFTKCPRSVEEIESLMKENIH